MTSQERLLPIENRPQPDRDEVARSPGLHIPTNNLARALLSRLRDAETDYVMFGRLAEELARLVIWHACENLPTRPATAIGFAGDRIPAEVHTERIAGLAILRAGILFQPPFRNLFPDAPLHHLGVERDETTLKPRLYSSSMPKETNQTDRVLVFDPMLATGGTAALALDTVRGNHVGPVDFLCLVAAPLGVRVVLNNDPNVRIFTIALDVGLNEAGFIIPGLGDAGDRYFGTL